MSKALIFAVIAAVMAFIAIVLTGKISIAFMIGALFFSGLSLVCRFHDDVTKSYIPGMDRHY